MRLNETSIRVTVGGNTYLTHSYPIQSDMKQDDALSRRTFGFVVRYAIMKVQEYKGGGGGLIDRCTSINGTNTHVSLDVSKKGGL
jgi:hypothetical protein